MKKRYPIIVLLLLTMCAGTLSAQDVRFSQYNANPLLLNPAMTGAFNGSYRVSAIYRSQWHSILKADDPQGTPLFRTFGASYDMRLPFGKTDAFGIGLNFLTDKAGVSEFSTNQLNLSVSYSKTLGKDNNHTLALGIQGGAALRGINYSQLRYGNQFNGEGFDPTKPSNENNSNNTLWFADVNVGLLYYFVNTKSFNKGRTNWYAGFAMSHLNQPNQSFNGAKNAKLYIKYTISGGAGFPVAPQVDLQPSFMVLLQGPSFEANIGSYVKVFFVQNQPHGNAFYIGPWFRMVGRDNVTAKGGVAPEAFILATKLDYSSFTAGFSFDINVSDLTKATDGNGGFEISLAHMGNFAKKNKVYFCPRF